MKKLPPVIEKLLNPPLWLKILIIIPSFVGVVYVLVTGRKDFLAYVFYAASAYSLAVVVYFFIITLPRLVNKVKEKVNDKAETVPILKSYLTDIKTKGIVSLYGGALADLLYSTFKLVTGVLFASVWSLSLAAYHFTLLALKIYLIFSVKKENNVDEVSLFGYNRYRITAWLIFLLNVPIAGIAALTIVKDSGFVYPGYVIYVSAVYSFYKIIWAVINVVRFRKTESPVLSASKAVNLVSALVSVFGLQTAMLTAFSTEGRVFRMTMNFVTGAAVFVLTAVIAVYMIIRANGKIKQIKLREKANE